MLHDCEITYSVTSSYENFPEPTTLKGIYKTLAHWQITSLKEIGITATMSDGGRGSNSNYTSRESCFLTSIQSEVIVDGKKLCGSAQKRGNHSFLQHGSIPVELDEQLFLDITGENENALHAFTTLRKEGYRGSSQELIGIMRRKFEEVLGCKLANRSISDTESEKIFILKAASSCHIL